MSGFPSIISDNQMIYIGHLEAAIESIDYQAGMSLTLSSQHLVIRVVPSNTRYINLIIESLNQFHNKLGFNLDYSKSMKSSGSVSFKINLEG